MILFSYYFINIVFKIFNDLVQFEWRQISSAYNFVFGVQAAQKLIGVGSYVEDSDFAWTQTTSTIFHTLDMLPPLFVDYKEVIFGVDSLGDII